MKKAPMPQSDQTLEGGLFRNVVLSLGIILALVYLGLTVWASNTAERQAMIRLAHSYSEAVMSFRAFYAETVVGRVGGLVEITHDYRESPHSLPIPATMTLDLVDFMNERDQSLSITQISEYPFPWRAGRDLTESQQKALNTLLRSGEESMSWSTREDGQPILNHAMAIRMDETCVACHNTHPDSPKTDWQVGDLRAVQIVSVPFRGGGLVGDSTLVVTAGFVLASFVAAFLALFAMDKRVRRALRLAREKTEAHAQALADLEERQYALDQHAIVSMADHSGRITYANDKFQKISGYTLEELIGQNHRMVKSGRHTSAFYKQMWDTIAAGKVWHGEVCNKTKQGAEYWVAATIVPFKDKKGRPRQYVSIRTDITERKRIEHDIADQQRFLKSLTDALGEGVYAIDLQGHCTFINPEGERLLGLSHAALQGRGIHGLIHHHTAGGEPLPARHCPLYHAMKAGQVLRSDTEVFLRPDGTAFPVALVAVPLWNEDRSEVVGQVVAFEDITEAKARRDELERARDAAEQANRAKSDFLSSMSHELRTPLNAILGFAQILEQSRKEPLSEKQKKHVSRILSGGKHLLALINDILDLAKIEEGKMSLSLEPVNTHALLEDCLHTTRSLADPKGITVSCPACAMADLPWIKADLTRTRQVLLNLMSNAVKYNRPEGSVTVTAELRGQTLRISVEDTGLGIPSDQQDKLFQPFSRLGHENSGIEGTGIGLTITKRLIEQMGGAIGFSSTAGEGSVFWVDLPRGDKGTGAVVLDGERALAEGNATAALSVLYVEDNPANVAFMEIALEDVEGYTLTTAHTAELGVEMARANPPDLILMDINLPGMDGFGALKALKADPRTAAIPVIALSADAMPATIRRGEEAGFAAYLTKPVQIQLLIETFQRVRDKGDRP